MNGKKAKLLRKEAAKLHTIKFGETLYEPVHGSQRGKSIFDDGVLGLDGKPTLIGKFTTATFKLVECHRKYYKKLKQFYKLGYPIQS